MNKFDSDMKSRLKEDLEIPAVVKDGMQHTYKKIRSGVIHIESGRQKKHAFVLRMAVVSASLVAVCFGIFYVNPALARDIPLLGDVFARLRGIADQDQFYGKDKTAYENIKENSKPVETDTNTAESSGIQATVSDAYCDGYDLYFTLSLIADDPEIQTADYLALLQYKEDDPIPFFATVNLNGTETWPISMTLLKSENGVFTALVRIPGSTLPPGNPLTENTAVTLSFNAVGAHKQNGDGASDDILSKYTGFKSVTGDWNLAFPVTIDTSRNRTAKPNIENNGFVLQKVTATPSNLHVSLLIPSEWAAANPACILTDGNGSRVYDEMTKDTPLEDGRLLQEIVFDQTGADQFTLSIIDKNGSPDYLKEIANIPFMLE